MILALVRRNSAMFAGVVAQAMQYGAALFLLPVLFTRLTRQEIGVWYLFVAIQGLAMIADFGFQLTFARNIALAYSGAVELQAQGVAEGTGSAPNWQLLGDVLGVARQLYLGLSALLFLILATGGLWYVTHVAGEAGLAFGYIARSWLIFSFGVCLGIYFQWISPLLIGTNRVSTNYLFLIVSRGGFALVGIVVLLAGGRLTALALALVATDVAGRVTVLPSVRDALLRLKPFAGGRSRFRQVFAGIWPNASRQGIVGIASFLILRYNAFVIATYFGLGTMASFGVTLQLVTGLQQAALLPITVVLPQLVAAQVQRDRETLRRRWRRGVLSYAILFGCGVLALVLAGGPILTLVGARVSLLPLPLLLLVCAIMALEGNHMVAASIIMSGNRVPFALPAILSGIMVAVLSTGAAVAGMGLTGVILAQGIVQLAYNNWKWPLTVFRETRRA